jgi:hypothetical protein
MEIKLLKNHVLGKQGDIINPDYDTAKYLIKMGVALEQKQAKDDVEEIKTEKIVDNGSNTKKRAARKNKANA